MTFRGLVHDREFMIVDEDGSFRSQRSDPMLAIITPSIENDLLTLAHQDFGSTTITIDRDSHPREVTMFGRTVEGVDQGDRVARWLSDVIGDPSRLVRMAENAPSFADSSPIHILSENSLHGLNTRLDFPVPINRFRPNIVVTGWTEPHVEDRVRSATVGTSKLEFHKLAVRCTVTTVEQTTGDRNGPEPLRTLATYRRGPEKGVVFGAKFAVTGEGTLSVGDEFTIARESAD